MLETNAGRYLFQQRQGFDRVVQYGSCGQNRINVAADCPAVIGSPAAKCTEFHPSESKFDRCENDRTLEDARAGVSPSSECSNSACRPRQIPKRLSAHPAQWRDQPVSRSRRMVSTIAPVREIPTSAAASCPAHDQLCIRTHMFPGTDNGAQFPAVVNDCEPDVDWWRQLHA